MGEPKSTMPRLAGERSLTIGDAVRKAVDRCAAQQREGLPDMKKSPASVERSVPPSPP